MASAIVQLDYPSTLLHEPVLQQLIRSFDLTLNILQAQITLEEGWLIVELSADQAVIEQAIQWLMQRGIEVTETEI